MGLRTAVGKLNEFAKDMTTLHVQTFTGVIEFEPSSDFKLKIKEAKAAGTVKLIAETYIEFDGDSYNFLTAEGGHDSLLISHYNAVTAGLEQRRGIVEMFKDIIKK